MIDHLPEPGTDNGAATPAQRETAYTSLVPLFPMLAAMSGLSIDRIAELVTLILGGTSIAYILKGVRQHDRGEHDQGSRNVGIATLLFFLTALIGECLRRGVPGIYTAAEAPFLMIAAKESKIATAMEHFRAEHALILNGIVHGTLAATGNITSLAEVLAALGFTGLSTALAMDHTSDVRGPLSFYGTAAIFLGSLLQTLPTLPEFLRSGDIKDLAVVPFIWTTLNGIFLAGMTTRKLLGEIVGNLQHILVAAGDQDPGNHVQPEHAHLLVHPLQR